MPISFSCFLPLALLLGIIMIALNETPMQALSGQHWHHPHSNACIEALPRDCSRCGVCWHHCSHGCAVQWSLRWLKECIPPVPRPPRHTCRVIHPRRSPFGWSLFIIWQGMVLYVFSWTWKHQHVLTHNYWIIASSFFRSLWIYSNILEDTSIYLNWCALVGVIACWWFGWCSLRVWACAGPWVLHLDCHWRVVEPRQGNRYINWSFG
jgi:hypothetical protein